MTHAAKGQHDTNGLEFRRVKMYHGQGHASRASAVHGGCVRRGRARRRGAGALAMLRAEEAALGLRQRHGAGILEDRGSRDEESSEAARGVWSRIIKKKRSLLFSLFLPTRHI